MMFRLSTLFFFPVYIVYILIQHFEQRLKTKFFGPSDRGLIYLCRKGRCVLVFPGCTARDQTATASVHSHTVGIVNTLELNLQPNITLPAVAIYENLTWQRFRQLRMAIG